MNTADVLTRSEIEQLVKAGDIPEQDENVVAGMLDSPALHAAPLAFWRACTPALLRLGKSDLAVRAWLLALLPDSQEAGADELWFDLLENTGAVRGLIDVDDDPGVARPPDGAAGWLARVVRWQDWGRGELGRSARLLELVERMAPRLRAEATVLELIGEHVQHADPDLLDLCLTLDLQFAVPDNDRLTIRNWLDEDPARRRDLAALARFNWSREVLARDVEHEVPKLVNGLSHDPINAAVSRAELQALLEHAGTREIIGVWLQRVAEPAESGALPVLEKAITALAPVVPEVVLAVAPALADRLSGAGIGRALARTLRIGLFDELGWTALEQAVAEYPPPHPPSWSHSPHSHTLQFQVSESWPALILTDSARITVAGPDRVLLRHDVRTPPDRPVSEGRVRAEYVNGLLLVTWRHETGRLGYSSDHPDDVFRVKKNWLEHYDDRPASGLSLPGGRSGGGRPLRPGDRTLTPFEPVASDGERWWRQINSWSQFDHYWEEYDPRTGAAGTLPAGLLRADTGRAERREPPEHPLLARADAARPGRHSARHRGRVARLARVPDRGRPPRAVDHRSHGAPVERAGRAVLTLPARWVCSIGPAVRHRCGPGGRKRDLPDGGRHRRQLPAHRRHRRQRPDS